MFALLPCKPRLPHWAFIYSDQAVVIFCQAGALVACDVTVAFEGIVFDNFSDSEAIVSQAQSTVLSSFTIAMALAATAGGVIYDLADWKGISVFHMSVAGGQLIVMAFQPAIRQSFRTFLHGAEKDKDEDEDEDDEDAAKAKRKAVQPPVQTAALPGVVEDEEEIQADTAPVTLTVTVVQADNAPAAEKVEEKRADDHENGQPGEDSAASSANGVILKQASRASRNSKASKASSTLHPDHDHHHLISPNLARSGVFTGRSSRHSSLHSSARSSQRSEYSGGLVDTYGTGSSKRSRANGHTHRAHRTRVSGGSSGTSRSAGTVLSRVSNFSSLSRSGEYFQFNFGIMNSLRPNVASDKVRMAIESDHELIDEPEVPTTIAAEPVRLTRKSQKSKGLGRDMYLVAFLIAMCSFNNTTSYAIEWATYAIFFKEQHGWTSATWAGICQTSGDLFAAFMMGCLSGGQRAELSEVEGIRWLFYSATSQPYNLVLFALAWVTLDAGLCVPVLPVAVASQVIMGTVYVYAMKAVTDMNLFYSLGDSKVFMQLQVQCRNADTLGNMLSGYLTLALYEMDPLFPYFFSTGLSIFTCITVMLGFYCRVGFGLDIETAEARRSQKRGMIRQSQWKSDRMKNIRNDADDGSPPLSNVSPAVCSEVL